MPDQLQVRTVRLELLRSGPSHNQLLSPLTPYLGICGDAPAGVVHVPYEHAVFERRLADLRYGGISADRLANLRDTGVDVARMLAAVPGLPGAITTEPDGEGTLVHLRVTLSASELALLPFELSKVPITTEGQSEAWLALQTKPPVCITRHIRTVSAEGTKWPERPRLLFIAGPTADIPFDAHRRALEQAIAPFRYPRRDDPVEGIDARHTHYGELLTIIESASLDNIVTACRSASYTHVHVLAHGAVDVSSKGKPFGIRLRGRNGGSDIVSGERFSSALARVDKDRVCRPFVVTLASCDAGLVVDVVEPAPGASFAHTLHQSGIPLVVGSQFPLTKDGSVTMVEVFYAGLLRGDNPHVLAHQTRSELHARYGADTHDWASLIVYEALPANLEPALERVRYAMGRLRIDCALERVDIAVRDAASSRHPVPFDELEADVRSALDELPAAGLYAIECQGLRATALKRLAQATFVAAAGLADPASQLARSCERLEDALTTYRAASEKFLRNDASTVQRVATLHWVLVQQLVMQAVLRQRVSPDILAVATHAATLYLDHPDIEERAWARASLAELALLRLMSEQDQQQAEEYSADVLAQVQRMTGMFPAEHRFMLASTEKQFRRYIDWWGNDGFESFVHGRTHRQRPTPWHDTRRVVQVAEEAAAALRSNAASARPERTTVPPRIAAPAAAEPVAAPGPTLGRTPTRRPRPRPRETTFVDVHMLPAQWGDCLWIEYGTDPRRPSRVLVDCGTRSTSARLLGKIDALPEAEREVELFILTHIDDDHIGGAIPFLEADLGGARVQDIWFNGYKHLKPEILGAEQGERFSSLIRRRELPWNVWQDGKPIVVPDDGDLPELTLPGGMKLTLLSPTFERLEALRVKWEQELHAKGIEPGALLDAGELLGPDLLGADDHSDSEDVEAMAALPFTSDKAAPNGSSIAVLAEFEGKSILLAADAHPPVLEGTIGRLLDARGLDRLPLSAMKVSHHGSHSNTSPKLLDLLDCRRFLISTNGQKFNHPHRPTISRIIQQGGPRAELLFNYRVKDKNAVWGREDLQERYRYRATYPQTAEGLLVRL